MSLFKKYICSGCSQKISSVARRFSNEKILCGECAMVLSALGGLTGISYEQYEEIKEYQDKKYEKHYQLFNETDSYQNIHMDFKNLLFYIGDKINPNTVFLEFENIMSCEVRYSASLGATAFLGSAPCTVSVCIKMKYPNITYQYNLHDRTKTKYVDSDSEFNWALGEYVDTDYYSCSWPSSLRIFLGIFYSACKKTEKYYDIESGEFSTSSFSYERGRNKEDSYEYLMEFQMEEYSINWDEPSNAELEEESKQNFYESMVSCMPEKQEMSEQDYMELTEYLQSTDEQSGDNI